MVTFLCASFRIPQRRACRLIGIQRSSYYDRSRKNPQTELRVRLKDLAGVGVRYAAACMCCCGAQAGRSTTRECSGSTSWKASGLRLKTKKQRVSARRVPLPIVAARNECWGMGFVADRLADRRAFRLLTLVDNFSRVSRAIEVDFSLTGKRVVEVLERLKLTHGLPKMIKVDNGSGFISKALDEWAHRSNVKLDFS